MHVDAGALAFSAHAGSVRGAESIDKGHERTCFASSRADASLGSRIPGRADRRSEVKRRWRFYRTPSGRRVIDEYFDALSETDASAVAAAMRDVRDHGLEVARHLRDDIYEVRADGVDNSYRLLFAAEGRKSRILLGLHAMQ